MKSDSVSVKVIEDGKTEFVTLPVVRLRPSGSAGVGPVDPVVPTAAGPPDVPVVDLPSGPEVSLAVLGDQAEEVILLGAAVEADGDHVVGGAEPLCFLLGEL